jgi:Spy/CpxP family protein refolding chaperone
MNTHRITATVIAAGALATGAIFAFGHLSQAQAQTPAPTAQHAGQGRDRMKKVAEELGLTEDQKAKIKPIMQAQREKMQAVRANTSLAPEAMRAQMKQIMQDTQSQIRPILTADQIKKWDAMRAAAKERRQEGAGQ